jgi:hypothetical protein
MTSARLAQVLATLRMSLKGLADVTGYSYAAARSWIAGGARPPGPIAAWLERRAADWRADPPPRKEDGPDRGGRRPTEPPLRPPSPSPRAFGAPSGDIRH